MSVDSLEQPQTDPNVNGKDVKVLSEETIEEWTRNCALSQDEDFERVGILGRQANRSRVGMVQLVYVLVKVLGVQSSMSPEVEHVFEEEEECDLGRHQPNWRKRHLVRRHAKVAANRMKQVDERELAGEVGEENDLGAVPDLSVGDCLVGLDLPLSEVWHSVDDEPRSCSTKVDDLMQHKREETSGDDGIAHPDVVAGPGPLHPRKLAELHAAIKSVVRLRRVHGLEVRGDKGEIVVEQLHRSALRHDGG